MPTVRPYKICIEETPMKLLLEKEEEREKVKKKEQLEEETLKHMKERMVKETNEVEDPHPWIQRRIW